MKQRAGNATGPLGLRPLYMAVLLSVAVLVFCFLLYRLQTRQREAVLVDREVARMTLFSLLFQKELRTLSDNVISLSDGDGLRGFVERGDRVELARAARRAVFYSRQQPLYEQLRFIDEHGIERMRINHDGVVVPDRELQDKSTRPYFQRSFALEPGQLYISPFELNVEHGMLEIPYKPVLRFASPVVDSDGQKRGIYIVNFLASGAIDLIQQMRQPIAYRFRVLNTSGYWLKASSQEKEWSFMFPDRKAEALSIEDPALWKRVCSEVAGFAEYRGGLFSWTRLDLASCGSVSLSRDQICADERFIVFASEVTAAERADLGRNDRFVFLFLSLVLLGAVLVGARQYFARKESLAALRRSQEYLSVTLYSIGDAVIATDREGRITQMNRAAEQLTDCPLDRARGLTCGEVFALVDEESLENVPAGVDELLTAGVCSEVDRPLALVSRNGARHSILRSVSLIQGKDQQESHGVVMVFKDVTEARRLERTRAHFADRLEVANKELESFSYSVSHDLRAPLRHIQGYVDLFCRETQGRLSEKEQRYLNTIGGSARDMGTLIDDLLSFSRMGRAEMKEATVDPLELVKSVQRDLELALKGRSVEWKISKLPSVLGDTAMLRQVFANLLDNAVKYTRKKERALIEVECVGREGEYSVFRVRDNGAGFDMKYGDKLFGVFQRLHRSDEFEGTGIGLANVQRIVKRHGGRVWAEGKVGEGAAVYFTLKTAI